MPIFPGPLTPGAVGFATTQLVPIIAVTGCYVSVVWMLVWVASLAGWFYYMNWATDDLKYINEPPLYWNTLFLSTGILYFLLFWFLSPAIVAFLIGFILYIAFVAWYVSFRNSLVPESKRVLTKQHISQVLTDMGLRKETEDTKKRGIKETVPVSLYHKTGSEMMPDSVGGGEAVIVFKNLIAEAVTGRATDIHIEPKADEYNVRFRIDGILHRMATLSSELGQSVIQVSKVLSEMDISERRRSQEGNFSASLLGKSIDIRNATATSVHGELCVLRLLDKSQGLIKVEKLGMPKKVLGTVKAFNNMAHGMMLVSGPTGSGKTTTLYACLMDLDVYQKNIITLENPVEYQLDNITQTPINVKAGITFGGQLRSLLRQDPDVVMIGEVRDAETARIAMQAAQTGHLVYSTVHANDSVSTVFRVLDLGIEPYLISSALVLVMAQRLVRMLCDQCKVPYKPKPDLCKKLNVEYSEESVFYKAAGCERCQHTGYYGRAGLYEMFRMNDEIRDILTRNPSVMDIRRLARKSGYQSLQEIGVDKIVQGITSLKEVVRVTSK